jgi:hypothetical protein
MATANNFRIMPPGRSQTEAAGGEKSVRSALAGGQSPLRAYYQNHKVMQQKPKEAALPLFWRPGGQSFDRSIETRQLPLPQRLFHQIRHTTRHPTEILIGLLLVEPEMYLPP